MTNLEVLDASENCGIGDSGMKCFNLTELYASNNFNIQNVSQMTKLEILDARGKCGIGNWAIRSLNLKILKAWGNRRIRRFRTEHMTHLKEFDK